MQSTLCRSDEGRHRMFSPPWPTPPDPWQAPWALADHVAAPHTLHTIIPHKLAFASTIKRHMHNANPTTSPLQTPPPARPTLPTPRVASGMRTIHSALPLGRIATSILHRCRAITTSCVAGYKLQGAPNTRPATDSDPARSQPPASPPADRPSPH